MIFRSLGVIHRGYCLYQLCSTAKRPPVAHDQLPDKIHLLQRPVVEDAGGGVALGGGREALSIVAVLMVLAGVDGGGVDVGNVSACCDPTFNASTELV